MSAAAEASLRKFNRSLDGFMRNVEEDAIPLAVAKIALDGFSEIVKRTPVDTGRARGNWQIGINVRPTGEIARKDKTGTTAVNDAAIKLIARPLPRYPVIYITNNVGYIAVLEQGGFKPPNPGPSKDPRKGRKGRTLVRDGYSVQAPQGMVAVTLERLRRAIIVDRRNLERGGRR